MIVVADTTPLNYLVLINRADLLPKLFGEVLIPPAVLSELRHIDSPPQVKAWITAHPDWLFVRKPLHIDEALDLGAGEREAIALVEEVGADMLLVDERQARKVAAERGISITGTLGLLKLATTKNLINADEALEALRSTSFFVDDFVIERVFGKRPT